MRNEDIVGDMGGDMDEVKVLDHTLPSYKHNWWGAYHVYRFGFVDGMRSMEGEVAGSDNSEFIIDGNVVLRNIDINYLTGFKEGTKYRTRWRLKRMLRNQEVDI